MAVPIVVCSSSAFDYSQVQCLMSLSSCRNNWSNMQRSLPVAMRNHHIMFRDRRSSVKVFASRGNASQELGSEDNAGVSCSEEEDELSHVIKFKMSDFKIHDRVSIALGERVRDYFLRIRYLHANAVMLLYLNCCLALAHLKAKLATNK